MPHKSQPFARLEVKAAFDAWPAPARKRMLQLRDLIFATAAATPGVGAIDEDLRWGQPSYLTTETKSGTAVRLGYIEPTDTEAGACGVYVHCQTNIVAGMRRKFRSGNGTPLTFEGSRCVRVTLKGQLPVTELREFCAAAFTYKLNRKTRTAKAKHKA